MFKLFNKGNPAHTVGIYKKFWQVPAFPRRAYSIDTEHRRSGLKPILFILGLPTVGGGGVVIYVRNDLSAQNWIKTNIPGGENIVQFICQPGIFNPVTEPLKNAKQSITDTYSKFGLRNRDTGNVPKSLLRNISVKVDSEEKSEIKPPEMNKNSSLDTAKNPKSEDKPAKTSAVKPSSKKEEAIPKDKKKVVTPKKQEINEEYINKLVEKVDRFENLMISTANHITNTLKDCREQVIHLIDEAVGNDDDQILYNIRTKLEEKEELMLKMDKYAKRITKYLEKLRNMVHSENVNIADEKKDELKKIIESKEQKITDALSLTNIEKSHMLITEEYYNKLIEARNQLSNSLGMIFPDLNVSSIQDASNEELELFMVYAYRLIKFYQNEVEKLQAFKTAQLNKIFESLKDGSRESIMEAVNVYLEKEKRLLTEKFIKDEFNLRRDHEKKLRSYLKRQSEVHNDHIADVIDLKNKELDRKLKQYRDKEIESLRIGYNQQLSKMINYLKHLDGVIAEKTEAEKRSQRSKLLWIASQSLILSLSSGTSIKPWNEQLKPLETEVHAITTAAAEGDELVNAVVSSIPKEARYRGVYSELALRDRFLNVEKIALRLANVPNGHASLVSIFLSYLQSVFTVKIQNPIPANELANEPFDPSTFTNYDILCRARYWIDRGDFLQTLRYMNLLSGASRAIAAEWMKEARMFLETKQAANALLFYSIYSSRMHAHRN